MEKFIVINKLNKKAQKERNTQRRVQVMFNTGTQIHKDKRKKSRAQHKINLHRELYSD